MGASRQSRLFPAVWAAIKQQKTEMSANRRRHLLKRKKLRAKPLHERRNSKQSFAHVAACRVFVGPFPACTKPVSTTDSCLVCVGLFEAKWHKLFPCGREKHTLARYAVHTWTRVQQTKECRAVLLCLHSVCVFGNIEPLTFVASVGWRANASPKPQCISTTKFVCACARVCVCACCFHVCTICALLLLQWATGKKAQHLIVTLCCVKLDHFSDDDAALFQGTTPSPKITRASECNVVTS